MRRLTPRCRTQPRSVLLAIISCIALAQAQRAFGPVVPDTNIGWVHDTGTVPHVEDHVLTVKGDTRIYLVQDHHADKWSEHQFMRFDLQASPLSFELDLSNVRS